MITGLAHVCFVVRDLKVSEDFFCNKLGLKPAFDFIDDKGQRFGLYVHAGERTFIELFQGELAQPADGQSFKHICLEVDDINRTVADMKAHGVQVTEVKKGSDNSWQAWLADPDGNRIELHGYTPQSKQMPWIK